MKATLLHAAGLGLVLAFAVPAPASDTPAVELAGPETTPASCPAWAREVNPEWVLPYVGYAGTPSQPLPQ